LDPKCKRYEINQNSEKGKEKEKEIEKIGKGPGKPN
jgi:hypothetical protein